MNRKIKLLLPVFTLTGGYFTPPCSHFSRRTIHSPEQKDIALIQVLTWAGVQHSHSHSYLNTCITWAGDDCLNPVLNCAGGQPSHSCFQLSSGIKLTLLFSPEQEDDCLTPVQTWAGGLPSHTCFHMSSRINLSLLFSPEQEDDWLTPVLSPEQEDYTKTILTWEGEQHSRSCSS